jgi:hypothetical protein
MVIGPALITVLLLSIPLAAMKFYTGVVWTFSDFIIAGTLIFGTGLLYKLFARFRPEVLFKTGMGLALITGLLLIWVNMAVGIVGSENNPFNLVYFTVVAAGLLSGFWVQFKPTRLMVVISVMAILMIVISIVAIITGQQSAPGSSVMEILGIHGFFALLFMISALLLRFEDKKTANTIS